MLVLVSGVLLILYLLHRERMRPLERNPAFAIGIITGTHIGRKGGRFVDYSFKAGNYTYKGSMSDSFCHECDDGICCRIGARIKIKYAVDYPLLNEPVHDPVP